MSNTKQLTASRQLDEIETAIDTLHAELRDANIRKRKVITEFMKELMSDKVIALMSTTQLATLMSKYISKFGRDK
jgi:hypothetical protein